MKIKKLSKQEINKWIGKNVPDDLSMLNFTKMMQDFQQSICKINLEERKQVTSVKCVNCGCKHPADLLLVQSIYRYVPPRGCTDGDYWQQIEYGIHCDKCANFLQIPKDIMLQMPPTVTIKKVNLQSRESLFHRDCKFTFKSIYV